MRIARIVIVTIAAGALLALAAGCNEGGPEMPAPSQGEDGTTEFSKASTLSKPQDITNKVQVVMDNIAGQSETVKGAVAGLKMANEMVAELAKLLAELQAEAPQKAEGESDEDYQKRLAAFRQKVAAAQKDLQQAQEAVEQAVKAVDAAQKELRKMQSGDLPAAQKKDAKEMEQYFEEEKKKLETAQEQNAVSLQDVKTESDTDTANERSEREEGKDAVKKGLPSLGAKGSSSTTGQQEAADPRLSGGGAPDSSNGIPLDK